MTIFFRDSRIRVALGHATDPDRGVVGTAIIDHRRRSTSTSFPQQAPCSEFVTNLSFERLPVALLDRMKCKQRLHGLSPKGSFITVQALEHIAMQVGETQETIGQLPGG